METPGPGFDSENMEAHALDLAWVCLAWKSHFDLKARKHGNMCVREAHLHYPPKALAHKHSG